MLAKLRKLVRSPRSAKAGEGVFSGMGRAGSADVFRIATDELLIAPLVMASDGSKATELAYLEDLVVLPAKGSTSVGRIAVSDVLAVVSGVSWIAGSGSCPVRPAQRALTGSCAPPRMRKGPRWIVREALDRKPRPESRGPTSRGEG